MKTKKYSYSKINSFNNCPLRYRFIYIDRIKKKDEGIEAFLGKVIHRCLEWIYAEKINNDRTYYSLDIIVNKFKEFWDESWHDQIRLFQFKNPKKLSDFVKKKKMDYYTLGVNWLVSYYSRYGPYFNDNVVNVEEKISFSIGGYTFNSIIDRVDMINLNSIKVLDYKTGKKYFTEKKLLVDLQMGIYYYAIQSKFPDIQIENITLSHFYIRDNKEVCIKASDINEDNLRKKILKNILT